MFTLKLLGLKRDWVGFHFRTTSKYSINFLSVRGLEKDLSLKRLSVRLLFHCIIVPVDPEEHTADSEMLGIVQVWYSLINIKGLYVNMKVTVLIMLMPSFTFFELTVCIFIKLTSLINNIYSAVWMRQEF